MARILRSSSIEFGMVPAKTETLDGWQVVKEYKDQKKGPFLIDLSHKPSWDLQCKELSIFETSDFDIPEENNRVKRKGNLFISRMNATQCQAWSMDGVTPELGLFNENCTQITDGQAVLGIMGRNLQRVVESFTPLDIFNPGVSGMTLIQGPLFHVPCQILLLDRSEQMQVMIISCARGYGSSMAQALLKSGESYGLAPGGEDIFNHWLAQDMNQDMNRDMTEKIDNACLTGVSV